jgi:hypothetical protein
MKNRPRLEIKSKRSFLVPVDEEKAHGLDPKSDTLRSTNALTRVKSKSSISNAITESPLFRGKREKGFKRHSIKDLNLNKRFDDYTAKELEVS